MTPIHQQARDAAGGPRETIPPDWARSWGPPRPAKPRPDGLTQQERHRNMRRQIWIVTDPNWRNQANCKGTPSDMFFPARGESSAEAKAVCADCPVTGDCLADAMIMHEKWGIRGGLTEKDRRRIRQENRMWG